MVPRFAVRKLVKLGFSKDIGVLSVLRRKLLGGFVRVRLDGDLSGFALIGADELFEVVVHRELSGVEATNILGDGFNRNIVVVREAAGRRASSEEKVSLAPVDERVAEVEPVVADEDVVLAAEVDYGKLALFTMYYAVGVPDLHLHYREFLDVPVQGSVGVVNRSLVEHRFRGKLVSAYVGGVDRGFGAPTIEERSGFQAGAGVRKDEDDVEVELEFTRGLDVCSP